MVRCHHANEPSGPEEAVLALQATELTAGEEQADWLYQLVRAIMTDESFDRLLELRMLNRELGRPKGKYEWAKYNQGKAEYVVAALTQRQIVLSEEQRQRILSEQDTEVLDRMFTRALTASTAADVLAGL